MSKALSGLMQRYGQTLAMPALVSLSEPTPTPMLLPGFAATLDVDIECVAFAPFAFDPLPADACRFVTITSPTSAPGASSFSRTTTAAS